MPAPFTIDSPAGAPLATFDTAGNLILAGGVAVYGGQANPAAVTPSPWPAPHPDVLAAAEVILPRNVVGASVSLATGVIAFTYFTAQKTAVATSIKTNSGSVAAVTQTTALLGLYSSDASGNLTLLAATANTPALWAATFTTYVTPLTTPFSRAAGQRYALAVLSVAATTPQLSGANVAYGSDIPPLCMNSAGGQAALPAAIGFLSLQATAFVQVEAELQS